VGADREVGDETVAVGDLAIGVDDLDLEPVDQEAIVAATQGNIVDPTIAEKAAGLAAPDRFLMGGKLDPGNVFGNQRMGGWLADEDEMPADRQHCLAQRLAGKQVVAETHRIEPGMSAAWPASQRLAAAFSQSCFSAPSCGTMNSGGNGTTVS
jgi:hypothetical protein